MFPDTGMLREKNCREKILFCWMVPKKM